MPTRNLALFGHIALGNQVCKVLHSTGKDIWTEGPGGQMRRFKLEEACDDQTPTVEAPKLSGSFRNDREEAEALWRVAHLYEALTGYSSGDPEAPRAGEPKPAFDPTLVPEKLVRLANKGQELGMSARQLQRWEKDLKEKGLFGLGDGRKRRKRTGTNVAPSVVAALREVFHDLSNQSDVTKKQVRILVALKMGVDELPGGSRATFDRLYDELAPRAGMNHHAKARRSQLAGPQEKMGFLTANRPGEAIIMDSTRADLFALDPMTGQWVGLELSVAMDLASRSVVSFGLTPVSTKGVDLIFLLADICSPEPVGNKWPTDVPYPYCGVPERVLLNALGLEEGTKLKPAPTMKPEMLLIDRGRNYQSAAFTAACAYLGIDIQSARTKRPQDKGWIERLIGTVQREVFQMLPGYTGPNPLHRGESPESEMVYTIDELQQILGRYFAEIYQNTPRDGLRLPEAPEIMLTPNEAYEEGISRSGFIAAPLDPDFHLNLLPTERRTISPDGIKNGQLRYDSPALDPYRRTKSADEDGKWPIRIDPRDLRQVWFQDPMDQQWHRIPWRYAREFDRPFGAEALTYIKEQVLKVPRPPEEKIAQALLRFSKRLKDGAELLGDRRMFRESARTVFTEGESRAARTQLPAPAAPDPEIAWTEDVPELETRND